VYLSFYVAFMLESMAVCVLTGIMWAGLVFTHSPVLSALVMIFGTWFFLSACWGIALVFRWGLGCAQPEVAKSRRRRRRCDLHVFFSFRLQVGLRSRRAACSMP
jgi:hypothetical protein